MEEKYNYKAYTELVSAYNDGDTNKMLSAFKNLVFERICVNGRVSDSIMNIINEYVSISKSHDSDFGIDELAKYAPWHIKNMCNKVISLYENIKLISDEDMEELKRKVLYYTMAYAQKVPYSKENLLLMLGSAMTHIKSNCDYKGGYITYNISYGSNKPHLFYSDHLDKKKVDVLPLIATYNAFSKLKLSSSQNVDMIISFTEAENVCSDNHVPWDCSIIYNACHDTLAFHGEDTPLIDEFEKSEPLYNSITNDTIEMVKAVESARNGQPFKLSKRNFFFALYYIQCNFAYKHWGRSGKPIGTADIKVRLDDVSYIGYTLPSITPYPNDSSSTCYYGFSDANFDDVCSIYNKVYKSFMKMVNAYLNDQKGKIMAFNVCAELVDDSMEICLEPDLVDKKLGMRVDIDTAQGNVFDIPEIEECYKKFFDIEDE